MKRLIMAIVCLMTMVMSANAQEALYGIWDSTDNKITVEINYDHMKLAENNESLVLFRDKKFKNYYCMFKLPGFGTEKIYVFDEYDIFDTNHMTMKLEFHKFGWGRTYRLVKRQ